MKNMKNIIAANQVQAESGSLTAAYKAADASIETAYKAADKTIADAVATNKMSQDAAIASAIAGWASDRQYKTDQITIRNKTFFLCLKDSIGIDPLTDTAGNWSVFTPGSANDVFANRSPVASDVYPVGVKWWDVSFGADTPLGFVSLGNGAWQFLNQITLSKIRFFGYGTGSTYQSNLNSIKFFKADGTQIANGWFVWGGSATLGKPQAGTAFNNQSITAQYNVSGWADLEPSALFDLSVNIAKVTASAGYFTFTKLQLIYSNGGIKTFSSLGDLSPVPQSRYGDSVAAALGETLTAAKLSDSSNRDPGRVTGEAFVSAWHALYQAQPAPPNSGITHAYANAADRAAGTGYTPTADDVAEANLFLELSTNTLWRCTDDNPLTWVQIAASIPQTPVSVDGVAALKAIAAPTDGTARFVKSLDEGYQFRSTYIANAAGTPIAAEAQTPTDGTPGVWLPVSVPRSADDWVIAATDRTNLGTYYTRRLVGATVTSIEFEVNEPSTENARTTKRAISIPDFPAVMAGTATVLDQQSVSANSGYYGGPTVFIRPSVGGVQSSVAVCAKPDGTVIIYNSNLAGTIAGLIRRVKINGIPANPQFYRNLTIPDASPPNWIDRMDYTVTATSIADGLVAGSLISGMPGVTFLRGSRDRKAIIKQATATTLGALFTAVNASLTAATLATTDIAYRRSVSAGWLYYDGTDPGDAATAVPAGWYAVSINGADLNIEPLATNVSQIVSYAGTSPDIPANIGMTALALNTGTNSITHWWNTVNLTWVAVSPNLPANSTAEHLTGETWTNGKPIYRKTWTGTTPNNANDNALFTVTGAAEIVRFFGRVVNGTRVADMFGVHSGSAAHGPAAQFYGNELHWFNNTADTRWQNGAYVVTVWYTK